MVRKVYDEPHDNDLEYVTGAKYYRWFEMTFFTRWDSPNMSQVLCVDTPPNFAVELKGLLERRAQPVNLWDPFAMHVNLVDQIILYVDVSLWRVRDPIRSLEKVSRYLRPAALQLGVYSYPRYRV